MEKLLIDLNLLQILINHYRRTIIELTGITDDMVKMHRKWKKYSKSFMNWIGDDMLVAHNAALIWALLNVGYKKVGIRRSEKSSH